MAIVHTHVQFVSASQLRMGAVVVCHLKKYFFFNFFQNLKIILVKMKELPMGVIKTRH